MGIIDQKILSYSWTVKRKIAFENSPGFKTQIDDLRLKPSCQPVGTKENENFVLIQQVGQLFSGEMWHS
jgi:hypothetical protein